MFPPDGSGSPVDNPVNNPVDNSGNGAAPRAREIMGEKSSSMEGFSRDQRYKEKTQNLSGQLPSPKLVAALADARLALAGEIHRDRVNPHFGSRYASLDGILASVVPVLAARGVIVSQAIDHAGDIDYLRTTITDGETCLEASTAICAGRADVQRFGSAVTYARRYSLAALLALAVDDDDDGNTAIASKPLGAYVTASSPNQGNHTQEGTGWPQTALEGLVGVSPAGSSLEIHFGKNKGTPLAHLTRQSLEWYRSDWEPSPNPRTGEMNPADVRLKAAVIDECARRDA